MTNHVEAVLVNHAKNRRRAAFVACALLLGIGWTAPVQGEVRNPVPASSSTQRVAPRPDGLRAAKLLQSVAVGDFNGDGIMDFAVADFLSDSILVMLGDAEGHFQLAAKLPSGGGPRSIVAGDFNHDGLVDLAVANFFSGDVTIFLGHGDGSFEDPHFIPLAPGLSSLAGADLHSDGSLDLVAANFLTGVLTVLKGAPDGYFEVEATLQSAPAVSLVYVQDFNGDGHPDLIAVDASEKQAWLFLGNGHGAFQPGKSIDPEAASLRLATQSQAAGTAAALNPLPAIAKAAGDGQLAYPGSVLPGNLVAALTESKGGVAAQKSMFFSSLYGGASVMGPSPAAAGDQGQVSAKVALSGLPGINFVATSTSGGTAAVFGEASVLQPADFFKQVESLLSPPSLGPDGLPGRQLLEKAQSQLKNNDVVGAVVTIEECLELLAPAGSQVATGPTMPGTPIDLFKRLLNQAILFGSNISGTISCGQTVSGSLAASQSDYYQFSANANEVITWAGVSTGGSGFSPCTDLYNGSGTEVGPGKCNTVTGPFTIPTTGTYTLVVHASNYSSTGSYNLNLQFTTGQCAASIGCGQTKSGTLVTAQQDAYSFSANAGEVVTFASVQSGSTSSPLIACADLYSVSGAKVASNPCNTANAPFTIPANGAYTLIVHDSSYYSTGPYNLNLQFTTGQCAASIGCGQTQGGTMATAQQDAYSFSANAGEVVTFASVQSGSTSSPLIACADLYNASGTKVASNPCNTVNGPFTIPTKGTYTLVVHDSYYYWTGPYNLNLQFPTGRCATSTGCGQTKSGTLVTAQQDVYSFSANAGEVVTFASVQSGSTSSPLTACADLYNASGTKIASNPCNTANAPFTIPANGAYTLVVHDSYYYWTGPYNLNLQFPTGRCATSTGCGQTKSGTLVTAQQDVYSFSANAGEVVTFASVQSGSTSSPLTACADLYNASGTKIASNPCNTANAPFTIPANGAYTLVVHDSYYYWTGPYNLNLQFPTGRCATSTGCGQIKSGTLVTAQQDAYSFSATAGEVVTFASVVTPGSHAACADLYNTSGTKIATNSCNNGVSAPFTIPTFGAYTLVVHDTYYYWNGKYNASWTYYPTACPAVTLSLASLNCGTQVLNTSSTSRTVTLSNTGNHAMTVNGITNQGANVGDYDQTNNCGTNVAAGANCSINVKFTPTRLGPEKTALTINDNAIGTPHRVLLTGTGTAVSLSPGSLGFGSLTVGTSSTSKQITVNNKGSATIEFFEIALGGANPGDFSQSSTCGSTLAAAASCTVIVTFKPTATGARPASVLFSDNGGGNLQSVALTGTGQ